MSAFSDFRLLPTLLATLAVGWGLGKATVLAQVTPGLSPGVAAAVTAWMRYVVPLALLAILIGFLWTTITGSGH